MTSLLKGLTLDRWYKALVYIGAIAFVLSFFVHLRGITETDLQMLSIGLILVGIGEWKNETHLRRMKQSNVYTEPGGLAIPPTSKPDRLSTALETIGMLLLLAGMALIISSSIVGT